jgi:uncharacterized protein (TIGR02145 family)
MSGIQQMLTGGTYTPPLPAIGAAYGGGFFAGQINVSGTKYNLVVAPRASGDSNMDKNWRRGSYTTTGLTSVINGSTNSASEAALGTSYEAATFCEDLNIGGYSDWYLPALNELEVLYYFLKPDTTANDTSYGSNANAVTPEPISQNYTSGSPTQTSASAFQSGNSEYMTSNRYWTSSETSSSTAYSLYFNDGLQKSIENKGTNCSVRAIRKVLA